MSETTKQEYSLEKLEDAVLAEVSSSSDSPQAVLMKIAQSQLHLARLGIADPTIVLGQYDVFFQLADTIAQYEGDAYEIPHQLLLEAIVHYSSVLRFQVLLIEKKADATLKKELKTVLESSVYASGAIIARFGSSGLKAAAGLAKSLPNKNISVALETAAEGGQQFLDEVKSSTSMQRCKEEIKKALDKGFGIVKAYFEKKEAQNQYFSTLDGLTGKLERYAAKIGPHIGIAEMIRNYSDWMDGYEHGKGTTFGVLGALFTRPTSEHDKETREHIATLFDPPPEVPTNPILRKESRIICGSIRSKLEIQGGPIAELCGIGVDLLSKPMPDAQCTIGYMKIVCNNISNIIDIADDSNNEVIIQQSGKVFTHLAKILADQFNAKLPAGGVHSRVSEIGLRIARDCSSLMPEEDGKEIKQLLSEVKLYTENERPRKIREANALDSYPKFTVNDNALLELFDSIRPIASKVGTQGELADILLSVAKKKYDGECLSAQKAYESNCHKAEQSFKDDCSSNSVSEEKVSAVKTKLLVSAGLVVGCIALIANMDAGFIKVLGYIVLVGSGFSLLSALFGVGTISTWNRLVAEKESAMSAAETAKSQSLEAAQSKLARYEDIASRLKSQGLQSQKRIVVRNRL